MLKHIVLAVGMLVFIATIPCISLLSPERVILGMLNPAEACLLLSVGCISLGLTLQAISIKRGGGTLERVVKKYGPAWHTGHRLTRGIALGLGGLPAIAWEVLGDEMESIGGQAPSRTWTINEVLEKLGLRPIPEGDVAFVTAIASKKAESACVHWTVRITPLDAETTDLFAHTISEQMKH